MNDNEANDETPGIALTVEAPDGGEDVIEVGIAAPADADAVLELVESMDDLLAEAEPALVDATMAALVIALGNHLRQAPQWPLDKRLDAFARQVQGLVDEAKTRIAQG